MSKCNVAAGEKAIFFIKVIAQEEGFRYNNFLFLYIIFGNSVCANAARQAGTYGRDI